MLDSGFFHADPHRGNLLRTPDGRLAYLDFGMMAQVPADARLGLVGAALGLQNRDLATSGRLDSGGLGRGQGGVKVGFRV